jgi:hypothetical protein
MTTAAAAAAQTPVTIREVKGAEERTGLTAEYHHFGGPLTQN